MANADIMAAIRGMREEIGLINRRVDLLATTTEEMIWRNVVPLDSGLLAVSHRMGWLIVPQEEYRSLLHLANGLGTHEPGTVAMLEALVRPGDTVIDVGAHIGLISLPLARLVGPHGRLLSLEPNARSAECLRRMLICNGMEAHTQVMEVAASDEDALVNYYAGANSMLGSLMGDAEGREATPVQSARIDSLVPEDVRIDLIKIDAEGFEPKVVAGLRRVVSENHEMFVIAECGPTHIERYGLNLQQWFDIFADAGLNRFVVIDEVSGRCHRRDVAELADIYSSNLLFYAHDNRRQDEISSLMEGNGSS